MKRTISFFTTSLLLIFSTLIINSCGNREETVSCFPNTSINVILNLNLPAYYALQTEGNWMYINEQLAGSRGLIVVRTSGGFKIYDRNAPHICPETNSTLNVVDNIKITCAADGAEWILLTGQPLKVAQIPPKMYPYSFNAANNTLTIYN